MAALWARLQCTVRIRGSFSRCLSLLVSCLGRKFSKFTFDPCWILTYWYYSVYIYFKHICISVFILLESMKQDSNITWQFIIMHFLQAWYFIYGFDGMHPAQKYTNNFIHWALKPKRCRRVRFWTPKIPSMRAKWPRHGAQCRKERRWKAGYSERGKVQNLIFTTWLYIAFHFQMLVSTSTNCLPKFQSGLTV